MIEISSKKFFKDLYDKLMTRRPVHGQIELTYKCEFKCPYCYIMTGRHKDDGQRELSFKDWTRILDELRREGCISLTLTGGDPLRRSDFEKIYLYAKQKGFILTVFTNATSLDKEVLDFFDRYKPFSIEITLNSLKENRFNTVTGTKGKFPRVIANINKAAGLGLPLILKTNALTINKDEVVEIKKFAKDFLGQKRYKFDTYITPGLDGNKRPLEFRLSPEEIVALEESDQEIKEALVESYSENQALPVGCENLYRCNTWMSGFYIDPYGRLRFCHITDAFSTDLKRVSFEKGFYDVFPRIVEETFTKSTKCASCKIISECMTCPARCYLEAGDSQAPVRYFCELAETRIRQKKRLR